MSSLIVILIGFS